jgi:hypothetical protein
METVILLVNEGSSVVVQIETKLSKGTFKRNVRYDYNGECFEYRGQVF